MNDTRYADVFIYVPSANQILRIGEGGGTNLLKEDEEAGYVDYDNVTINNYKSQGGHESDS